MAGLTPKALSLAREVLLIDFWVAEGRRWGRVEAAGSAPSSPNATCNHEQNSVCTGNQLVLKAILLCERALAGPVTPAPLWPSVRGCSLR